jgi:hypothetical protein
MAMCWSLNHKKTSKFIIMKAFRQEIPSQLDKTIVTACGHRIIQCLLVNIIQCLRVNTVIAGGGRNSAKSQPTVIGQPAVIGRGEPLYKVLKLTLLLLIFNIRYY